MAEPLIRLERVSKSYRRGDRVTPVLEDISFDIAAGDSKYLAGKLQEHYGWERDRAER